MTSPCVEPWELSDPRALERVVGVFSDIDDTLTTSAALTAEALDALRQLRDAALPVIAITGRPQGWSEPFARAWPVDAIVAENGAVALIGDDRGGVSIEYAQDAATRRANAARLRQAERAVLDAVPGARLAADSAGRVTDIAIDHAEHAHLTRAEIERVVEVMRSRGMQATVSSIHVNGWYGDHTKLSGARWMVERLFGRDLGAEQDRWLYVGDSTNDQLMFERFPLSVGVANIFDFATELDVWPAYVTRSARGAGFAEVAGRLIAAKRPAVANAPR